MNAKKLPLTNESAEIIDQLKLIPHPEGGWFRETYRSDENIPKKFLHGRYAIDHCFSTSIYFLLESGDFSAFHRVSSDEIWHFYLGSPIAIYILEPTGALKKIIMGNNIAIGHTLQYTIPRNLWFAARTIYERKFSLVGCTVSPGFEFFDFELGRERQLAEIYPDHASIISELTRG